MQRLLDVATDERLITDVLDKNKIDSTQLPLGRLVHSEATIAEAKAALDQVVSQLELIQEERDKSVPDADVWQAHTDKLAYYSSRFYELIPTADYTHESVQVRDFGASRPTRPPVSVLLVLVGNSVRSRYHHPLTGGGGALSGRVTTPNPLFGLAAILHRPRRH
jgi:hypothetical protein